jgi:membrane dipeptidase
MNHTKTPRLIVDAHQDIAWQHIEYGRPFAESVHQKRRRESADVIKKAGTASNGLPEAILGRVGLIFATLFAEPKDSYLGHYPNGYTTPQEAYQMALAQWDVYQKMADSMPNLALVRTQREMSTILTSWEEGKPMPEHKLGLALLMEGADPVLEPRQFEEWYARGVRIVGPAWGRTRYSGGTTQPGGLTKLGKELLEVLASFKAGLDLSHMAEEAYLECVDRFDGPIIASHSNPRRFRNTDRHLSDTMIRRLAERDGVMGMVIYNRFMWDEYTVGQSKKLTPINRVIEMIDYVCQLTGSARHIGIGTDIDGGFGAEAIPTEIDTIADLRLIGDGLLQRGYTAEDVALIEHGNFLRFLTNVLPAS